jgi:hypothetical protein
VLIGPPLSKGDLAVAHRQERRLFRATGMEPGMFRGWSSANVVDTNWAASQLLRADQPCSISTILGKRIRILESARLSHEKGVVLGTNAGEADE